MAYADVEKRKANQRQWQALNREKSREYSRRYRASAKGKANRAKGFRHWQLINDYGITVEQYEAMHAKQNGVCAICHRPADGSGRAGHRLHVDHDHATGVVRGLLCNSCNNGIGRFKDKPELLLAAAAYVTPQVASGASRSHFLSDPD